MSTQGALPSPSLAQSLGDHRSDQRVQTDAFFSGLGNQPRMQAFRHALSPLPTRRAWFGQRVAVFVAVEQVGFYSIRAMSHRLFWSLPIGDASWQVQVLNRLRRWTHGFDGITSGTTKHHNQVALTTASSDTTGRREKIWNRLLYSWFMFGSPVLHRHHRHHHHTHVVRRAGF